MRRSHYPILLTAWLATGMSSPAGADSSLYWTVGLPCDHDGRIERIGESESEPTMIVDGLYCPGGIAVDAERGRVYWSDRTEQNHFAVRAASIDGSGIETISAVRGPERPQLALDPSRNRLYVVIPTDMDRSCDDCPCDPPPLAGFVSRIDLDHPERKPVCVAGGHPGGPIAFDVVSDRLYWLDLVPHQVGGGPCGGYWEAYGRILEAQSDGSAAREVVGDLCVASGLAVAPVACTVYWSCEGAIRRVGVDGSNEELVTSTASGGTPSDPTRLAIAEGTLFWTESDRIRRADLDGGNADDLVTGLSTPYAQRSFLQVRLQVKERCAPP